jgi:hypothetical protein
MLFFKPSRRWGLILLGIWLILVNLSPLLSVSIPARETILAVLGVAAGVLILLDR